MRAAILVGATLTACALAFLAAPLCGCSATGDRIGAAVATVTGEACQFVEVADPALGLLGTFCKGVLDSVAADLERDEAAREADAGLSDAGAGTVESDAGAPIARAARRSLPGKPSPVERARTKLAAGAKTAPHGALATYYDATGREVAHVWPGVVDAADELLAGKAARR